MDSDWTWLDSLKSSEVTRDLWWRYLTRGVRRGDPFADLLYPDMWDCRRYGVERESPAVKKEAWLRIKFGHYDWGDLALRLGATDRMPAHPWLPERRLAGLRVEPR